MKKRKHSVLQKLFIGASCLVLVLSIVFVVDNTAQANGRSHYARNTYTWWSAPQKANGYTLASIDIRPIRQTSAKNGVFWAHQVWMENGQGGYIGLQNNGSQPTGKIAIFSLWDALAARGPQHAKPFGGEGTGYSVRIKYDWKVNRTYRLIIRYSGVRQGGDWWNASVRDMTARKTAYIGTIKVPTSWKGIKPNSVAFGESYLPQSSCRTIERSMAVFSRVRLGSKNSTKDSNGTQQQHGAGGVLCKKSRVQDINARAARHTMGF